MEKDLTYRLDDQIGYKLRLANQKHLEVFSEMMPGVTPTQFAVMARLHQTGAMSQNHLGRLVGMDAATTKGVIDRLRNKGFVASAASQTDLRRLEISLTPSGAEFIATRLPLARAISRRTLDKLTEREAARLLALLDKL